MMFTSMPPLRRHKDPRPYRVVETGERATAAIFGTPGVTVIFEPRAKYMPPAVLPVNEILDRVRDFYSPSNPWATSMVWLSVVAGWTEKISGEVPPAWRTDLPTTELHVLQDLVDQLGDEALPQLLHAGNVLERLADAAELAGKAYLLERKTDLDED